MTRCKAKISSGYRCSRDINPESGCTQYCWQHAYSYIPKYICDSDPTCNMYTRCIDSIQENAYDTTVQLQEHENLIQDKLEDLQILPIKRTRFTS
jgi:hypothetical protein